MGTIKGYLVVNGGEAFTPRTRQSDHTWLQLIRTRSRPRLLVVPTATVEKTRSIADQVIRYFNHLGTFAEYTMIVDPQSANTLTECDMLDKVDAIVLTDGSPIDLVERLRDTHTAAALQRALERKAVVMATGASAMGIGGVFWFGHEWEPGLGIAPQLAFMPHHNLIRMRLSPEKLLAELPDEITLIGIDDSTTLIRHPDGSYQVEGEGEVTVYHSVEHQTAYATGARFDLKADQNHD
jgi:cyanophycinase-like exopeptidase